MEYSGRLSTTRFNMGTQVYTERIRSSNQEGRHLGELGQYPGVMTMHSHYPRVLTQFSQMVHHPGSKLELLMRSAYTCVPQDAKLAPQDY